MQVDVTIFTAEAHEAIVECLRIAARRGRKLREQAARQTGSPQDGLVDNSVQPTSLDEQPIDAESMEPSSTIPSSDNWTTELVTAETKGIGV